VRIITVAEAIALLEHLYPYREPSPKTRSLPGRTGTAVVTIAKTITVAAGVFAPEHLGELTRVSSQVETGHFSPAWSIWIPGTCNGHATRQNPAYVTLVMTHGPGTLTGRTPVTVKVLPPGLVTLKVFALTCRTTEAEP
jgi:hypothetical protein